MKRKLFISMLGLTIVCTPSILPSNTIATTNIVQATELPTKPNYKTRAEIPLQYKWKLEDIYINKEAWEADVNQVTDMANQFVQYQGKLADSPQTLKQALDAYTDLMRKQDKASVYALLSFDAQSSNPEMQDIKDRSDKMSALVMEKISWLNPEIAAIPDDKMTVFLKDESLALAPYSYFISDILRTKPYTLSKELEQLLAQSSPLSSIPEDTFNMLTKDIKLPSIKDETGKEVELTSSNFATYLGSKNREV